MGKNIKLKLKSKGNDAAVTVNVYKGNILMNKQGMVLVEGHPMYIHTISPEALRTYYKIPEKYDI